MFDYLIQNGQVIDGTGAQAYRADVAISGGKIAAVGELKAASAAVVVDAADTAVAIGARLS